jgi:hypothetical protein
MNSLTPERREEIAKASAANRATQDTLSEDQSEAIAHVKIALVRSSDDPTLFSSEFQTEVQNMRSSFRQQGIEADTPFMVMDAPAAGGGYLGEFIMQVAQIGVPAVAGIVGAWLHGRFGRKVRVEFHADGKPKRIEAQTPEQVISIIEITRREAQPRPAKKPTNRETK